MQRRGAVLLDLNLTLLTSNAGNCLAISQDEHLVLGLRQPSVPVIKKSRIGDYKNHSKSKVDQGYNIHFN